MPPFLRRFPPAAPLILPLLLPLFLPAAAGSSSGAPARHPAEVLGDGVRRCGTRPMEGAVDQQRAMAVTDCTAMLTSIREEYFVDVAHVIPVWWHVISSSSGEGDIPAAAIQAQMQVLNEDFRAMAGTMGSDSFDLKIQFELAGITRTSDDTWYGDGDEAGYKAALARDPERFLNIYTNNTSYLGYAYFPQDDAGTLDGIVLRWGTVGGRNNGYGHGLYDQGRTLVHEMGHYLGLYHTFEGGGTCANGYDGGDLIADTNAESVPHYDCTQVSSCGTPDPIHNYMSYTDDDCMHQFTREQANRAICSLVNYRPLLYSLGNTAGSDSRTFPWPLFFQLLNASPQKKSL